MVINTTTTTPSLIRLSPDNYISRVAGIFAFLITPKTALESDGEITTKKKTVEAQ